MSALTRDKLGPNTALTLPLLGFFLAASLQVATPILSLFIYETYRLTLGEVGYMLSIYYAATFLSAIPIGILVTSRMAYPALIAGFLVMFAGYLAFAFSPTPLIFMIISIFHGFGVAVTRATQISSVTLQPLRNDTVVQMRNYTTLLGVGFTAGPGIGIVSVALLGVRFSLVVAAIVALLGALLALKTRSRSSGHVIPKQASVSKADLFNVMKNKQVFTATLLLFTLSGISSVIAVYAPIYAKESFGLPSATVVALFFGLAATASASRLLIGKTLTREKLIALTILSLIAASFGLLAVAHATFLLVFATGFLLLGFQQGLLVPLGALVIAGHTSRSQRVMGNSVGFGGQDLGRFIGPLIATLGVSAIGIPSTLSFYALVPILILAFVMAVRMKPNP